MSLDMSLELEGNSPDWVALEDAVRAVGVEDFENTMKKRNENDFLAKYVAKEEKFDGFFSKSRSHFYLYKRVELGELYAEGRHGCNFKVQYVIVFRINNAHYTEFVEDVYAFLEKLATISPMQFVLSFQSEEVYAIRNKQGFEFFWHAPR
ncbi:hypothetical protein PMI16_04607 [Herbaspirillum sp. CF444]|uniref:hypothetical protein n=1 Tax=Herbaspirillum sp. CF444 TaxID=1144319 RepID=UPI0002727F14|nr:hypothetical protein [Herbaspirillum sp. CF444]EJL81752.1 hypothetical protein PMI16_04607 [Herbaspirillum sp. CF444]